MVDCILLRIGDKMKTIIIQIGNSDNKLTQKEWSEFVDEINNIINLFSDGIHFFGGSNTWSPWQNVAWVFVLKETIWFNVPIETTLKNTIHNISVKYKQDSVAWTEGITDFI
jgi:flagellin-like hook-associated protein FlgL